jgi:hypothetical protein
MKLTQVIQQAVSISPPQSDQCYQHLEARKVRSTLHLSESVAYPGILFGGGVQQIQLRAEDRENGDLGAVAP